MRLRDRARRCPAGERGLGVPWRLVVAVGAGERWVPPPPRRLVLVSFLRSAASASPLPSSSRSGVARSENHPPGGVPPPDRLPRSLPCGVGRMLRGSCPAKRVAAGFTDGTAPDACRGASAAVSASPPRGAGSPYKAQVSPPGPGPRSHGRFALALAASRSCSSRNEALSSLVYLEQNASSPIAGAPPPAAARAAAACAATSSPAPPPRASSHSARARAAPSPGKKSRSTIAPIAPRYSPSPSTSAHSFQTKIVHIVLQTQYIHCLCGAGPRNHTILLYS